MYDLYNGDCLEVMQNIPDNSIDMCCTSPPYNIGKEYESRILLEEYVKFNKATLGQIYRLLKDGGSLFYNIGTYVDKNGDAIPLEMILYNTFLEVGFKVRQSIVWRFNSGMSAKKKFSGRYENIVWLYKGDKQPDFYLEQIRIKEWESFDKRNNPNGKNPTNVWHIEPVKGNSKEKTIHPCQFPLELVDRCIKSVSVEGDTVIDPFMGSGSTGVVCKQTNRNFIGIEKEEKYFNVAKERIEGENK